MIFGPATACRDSEIMHVALPEPPGRCSTSACVPPPHEPTEMGTPLTTDKACRQPTGSLADVLEKQLAAIDAWNKARRASEAAAASGAMKHGMRLDASQRVEVSRREHAAVIARADAHLREAGEPLVHSVPVRAVIAHRHAWLRDAVTTRLVEHGVSVIAAFEDGADAAGTVVVEQPELVFVEDLLPTLSGSEVLARVQTFSPLTLVGVQVRDESDVARFMKAGATAVFTRQTPPADIADQLLRCLHAEGHVGHGGRRQQPPRPAGPPSAPAAQQRPPAARPLSETTATTPVESQLVAQLRSELNGPLRSSLNTLSAATNLVAAEQGRMRPRAQEALQLLCQEVQWHQLLWIHLLHSLDAVANSQQPRPLPARPAGGS